MEVESYTDNEGNLVTIWQDEFFEDNPRDWDNMGVMACWHRRYNLGDEQPECSPSEYLEDLPEGTVILPLYLYDHSGITMSTTAFSCPWDSGQVGIIYATPEKVKECFMDDNVDEDRVRSVLVGEVETYDMYLTGEVYGYEVQKPIGCDACGNVEYEFVHNCGGFFGDGGIAQIKSEYPPRQEVSV